MVTSRALLWLAALLPAPLLAPQAAGRMPSLWAAHYAWYETVAGPHGHRSHWMDDRNPVGELLPKSRTQPPIVECAWRHEDLAPDYARLAQQARAAGRKVFLPVYLGHDNSGFRPEGFHTIPREDGATLRGRLGAGTDANADAVLHTSFSEWPGTTVVEPSASWTAPCSYPRVMAQWRHVAFAPLPLPGVTE